MTATETEQVILRAAANMLREQGIDLVRIATFADQRDAANAALLASINIEAYLEALPEIDRPF